MKFLNRRVLLNVLWVGLGVTIASTSTSAAPHPLTLKGGSLTVTLPESAAQPKIWSDAEEGNDALFAFAPGQEPWQIAELPIPLVNIGNKLWDLVIGNINVADAAVQDKRAHALPLGVSNPWMLEPWQGPLVTPVDIEYKNFWGMTLFKASAQVQAYYGAPYKGRGMHLSNIQVMPDQVTAKLGFQGNVQALFTEPVYKEGRVAAIILHLRVDLTGPMDNIVEGRSFEILGNGAVKHLVHENPEEERK